MEKINKRAVGFEVQLKVREASEGGESRVIEGYALKFGVRSRLLLDWWVGVYYEILEPGCITRETLDACDIMLTMFHDRQLILGRSKMGVGTLHYEIDEIGVGVLQVGDERGHIHLLHHLADAGVGGVLHVVDDGEERARVHSGIAASGAHGLVAEAKLDAETANDLQHAVVIADDIAHRVCVVVFLCHLCYLLFDELLFALYSAAKVHLFYNLAIRYLQFYCKEAAISSLLGMAGRPSAGQNHVICVLQGTTNRRTFAAGK